MSERYELHHGDCLDILRTLPDNSIDAVVTDPPYGLAFMGKKWDYDVPSQDIWRECLRVLKPGGHLLAFAGTRTQHRMAVRIEDAGFEIRDMIAWVYGSGFPKSLDVSKAIDKGHGENRDRQLQFVRWMRTTGITAKQIDAATNSQMSRHFLPLDQPAIATADMFDKLRPYLPEVPEYIERLVCERTGLEWTAYKQREVVGHSSGGISTRKELRNSKGTVWGADSSTFDITAPATDAAKQWQGWGTALKPALEPITVARKPLIGTVAENVLTWGTGGVNVDGCRVEAVGDRANEKGGGRGAGYNAHNKQDRKYGAGLGGIVSEPHELGRWPANLIHDGSEEVVGLFPVTGPARANPRNNGDFKSHSKGRECAHVTHGHDDAGGSAARFFYCAKASKRDRDEGCEGMEEQIKEITGKGIVNKSGNDPLTARFRTIARNNHPTVKPTDLMRYLCRLVTQPDGVVLDPFMGSGSTGKGAILEGFRFVGIEREAEYIDIARARIQHAVDSLPNTLFDNTGE